MVGEEREKVLLVVERLRGYIYKAYLDRTHAEQDKAGRMLTWLTREVPSSTPILQINNLQRTVVHSQIAIN